MTNFAKQTLTHFWRRGYFWGIYLRQWSVLFSTAVRWLTNIHTQLKISPLIRQTGIFLKLYLKKKTCSSYQFREWPYLTTKMSIHKHVHHHMYLLFSLRSRRWLRTSILVAPYAPPDFMSSFERLEAAFIPLLNFARIWQSLNSIESAMLMSLGLVNYSWSGKYTTYRLKNNKTTLFWKKWMAKSLSFYRSETRG